MVTSMDLLQQDYDSGMTTAPVVIMKMMTPVVGHGLIMLQFRSFLLHLSVKSAMTRVDKGSGAARISDPPPGPPGLIGLQSTFPWLHLSPIKLSHTTDALRGFLLWNLQEEDSRLQRSIESGRGVLMADT
ncbi:hypothetical protein F2Q70_00008085 [Brassica cretica]|uniref:Uncharacterized protein n=2 Tax=Brassica cretica TaxID=69181 RepID=A0A8S9JIM2_BRACR|nr:hypothetical protein F2Q68_00001114 [Brassica cretica]KAF2611975.1 hypothetical protein F2Q70_00008085 [Brassica cretica]KAF3543423.1 hypothetical protein DY000_02001452 [Brassica cretica]